MIGEVMNTQPIAWHYQVVDTPRYPGDSMREVVWTAEDAERQQQRGYEVTPMYPNPSRRVVDEAMAVRAISARNEHLRKFPGEAVPAMISALQAAALPAVPELLSADDVQWIVNDNSELGVMIRGQCFFLYKGDSLVYEDAKHDDGSPMFIRTVGKREFGECCHPIGDDISACGYQHRWGEVSLGDSDRWQPMPAATPAHDQPEGSDND